MHPLKQCLNWLSQEEISEELSFTLRMMAFLSGSSENNASGLKVT